MITDFTTDFPTRAHTQEQGRRHGPAVASRQSYAAGQLGRDFGMELGYGAGSVGRREVAV